MAASTFEDVALMQMHLNPLGEPNVVNLKRTILFALSGALLPGAALATESWPDTPTTRLVALVELQTLNADLLSHDSATLTLDRWCARHHLAEEAKIVAVRVKGEEKEPPDEIRAQLRVGAGDQIAYRRVRLRCGDHVLSEADNWYVPSRLTPEMNRALETSDTAFGRVVQPLRFQRHTLSAQLLWSSLPDGWDTGSAPLPRGDPDARLSIPEEVLEHKALLTRADGAPFSYVIETYTRAVLNFPPPGS